MIKLCPDKFKELQDKSISYLISTNLYDRLVQDITNLGIHTGSLKYS